MCKKNIYHILVISVLAACATLSYAQPDSANVWGADSPITGSWDTAANWEIYTLDPFFGEMEPTGTYGVPTSSDVAQVWSGLVQIDSAVTAAVVGIQTSSGSIEISGGSLTVSGAGGPEGYENFDIGRGLDASSTLTISGGTINLTGGSRLNIAKSGDISQGAIGVLNQTGGTINADDVAIGEIAYDDARANGYNLPWPAMAGSGAYNLSGGVLNVSAGSGLNVGKGIDGIMNVSNGAEITGSANVLVGAQANVYGELNVDGASLAANYIRIAADADATGAANFNDADIDLTGRIHVGLIGTGSMSVSGSTDINCDRILVADNAGSSGTFEMTGGSITADIFSAGIGAGSVADITLSGGSITTTGTSYFGNAVGGSTVNVRVTGEAEFMPVNIRMGWQDDSVTTLTIDGGAVETGYINAPENGTGAAIIKVIGSDPNRVVITTGRLQLRNSPNSELHFVLDNDGITPIQVLQDDVPLNDSGGGAPTIYMDLVEGFDASQANVGDSYDLITTTGAFNINIGGVEIVNNVGGYVDFDVEVVNLQPSGKALRATITNIDNSCAGQIAIGNILPGDFNQDCIVNIEDLAYFVQSWLICYDPQGCE